MAYAGQMNFPDEVLRRGTRAAEGLRPIRCTPGSPSVCFPPSKLAQTRPGARGALLFYSCVPVSAFGPAYGVPVQIHGMDADPIFVGEGDIDAARELVGEAKDGVFLYPGDQHYFADDSLPSYDPDATALLTQRVLDFLSAR